MISKSLSAESLFKRMEILIVYNYKISQYLQMKIMFPDSNVA